MIVLYSATICPFAQRTRALLQHLGVDYRLETVDLDDRDPEFLKQTPTGRVPLLVDGTRKLYESSVINEYLADAHGFAEAFADDPYLRARERLAMAQWDAVVLPAFYDSRRDAASFDAARRKTVAAELDEMVKTVFETNRRQGGLLAFHCAPFWVRMLWLRRDTPLAELIAERIELRKWLDGAAALPAIQDTLPDPDLVARRTS